MMDQFCTMGAANYDGLTQAMHSECVVELSSMLWKIAPEVWRGIPGEDPPPSSTLRHLVRRTSFEFSLFDAILGFTFGYS